MRSKLSLILLLILPAISLAQERPLVKGRVYSGSIGVKDVLVVNNNAQRETRTDSLGNFSLPATVGDLLIVSDYKIDTRKIRYTPDLVQNGLLLLEVKMAAEELDEVVINRSKITSESLGIPMGKAYTVQQRRLRAGSSDPVGLLINVLSGRYKMLKKGVETEKREIALDKLDAMFTIDFYVDELKLDEEYAKGFKYYAVENEKLREELKIGNRGLVQFRLAALAEEYKKIQDGKD